MVDVQTIDAEKGRGSDLVRIVLASYGTRGDIEPCIAIARALQSRGHDVRVAVPRNLVGFAEEAGIAAVAYGPDAREILSDDFLRDFRMNLRRSFWTIWKPIQLLRELWAPWLRHWPEMSEALTSVTEGADLLFTGLVYQELALNVAEHYDIPLVAMHYFPIRSYGQIAPGAPPWLGRPAMRLYDWWLWRMSKKAEDAQCRELGLPKTTRPGPRRIAERGSLEIQAYDEICFPGLAAEWVNFNGQRPFIGPLTMGLTTDADDEIAAWIAAGTAPICFGFGSMPVAKSPGDTVAMISAACAQLGHRALICSGWADYADARHSDHVKVVKAANYARVFPACRAVVYHGGSGTTGAVLRAGVPALILWTAGDQPYWGAQLKRLKVGTSRSFSSTTQETLVADLRQVLTPEYASNARELARRMSKASDSLAKAVELIEDFARSKSFA